MPDLKILNWQGKTEMNKLIGGLIITTVLLAVFGGTVYTYGIKEALLVWGASIVATTMLVGGVFLYFNE
jgi:uncharacterized membrane protein YraQ (UPF0718 family)